MCPKLNNPAVCFVIVVSMVVKISSKFEFSNINCTSLDKEYSDFEYCYLKSVNRSYKYVSIKANVFKKPITKAKINLGLFKRFNGYKPFMYNYTVDFCRFMKDPQSNPVANFFYAILRDNSNLNHTCPYNHNLVVDKLTTSFVNNLFTNVLPFPHGDYLIKTRWISDDIDRAGVKLYGTLS